MKSRRLSLSLLVALTTVVAGCGSDDDSPSADDTTAATEASDTTDAPSTPDADVTTTEDTTPDTTDTTPDTTDTSPDTTEDTSPDTTEDTSPDTTDTESTSPADGPGADSEFCTTAAEAEALGDEVDAAFAAGPEELEAAVTAAVEGSEATLELAPDDIADVMATNVDFQRRLAAILAEYDWDANAALATPEGEELVAEREEIESDLDRVRGYLEENCGIEDDSDEPDNSTSVTLPSGDAGLRRFIELYAIGASVDVTQEQEDCFVEELSGEVEAEQLELALTGEAPQEVNLAVGLAVLSCGIEVES